MASLSQFKSGDNPLILTGPAGALEAVVSRPDQPIQTVGIVCHPHPLFGGTMNNKVVTTIAKAFNNLGLWAVRFNFRGIGKSEGSFGNAVGEVDDLLAVFDWVEASFPDYRIWLAGFSFGSYVAARVAEMKHQVSQLVTIAPAVNHGDFTQLTGVQCPWLVIQGDKDEVVPAEQVMAWAESMPNTMEVIQMHDAGHFFHGRLVELREHLENSLKERALG